MANGFRMVVHTGDGRLYGKGKAHLIHFIEMQKSCDNKISQEDSAFLEENGIAARQFDSGERKAQSLFVPRVVWLESREMKNELLAAGSRIKEKHKRELKAMKDIYVHTVLKETPKQMRKMQVFELQYMFCSDGWFLLHCMKELVNHGKLKLPSEEQKKSLTTIIAPSE